MRRFVVFLLCCVVWWLLVWPTSRDASGNLLLDTQSVVVGAVAAFLVALYLGGFPEVAPRKLLQPRRYFWALCYVPVFAWYCLLSNLDVVYRVLHPRMPIRPGIVKIKTTLRTSVGRTALANSITLTPGTMTVDLDDEGHLYIHWIYVRSTDVEAATRAIVGPFEFFVRRIFE